MDTILASLRFLRSAFGRKPNFFFCLSLLVLADIALAQMTTATLRGTLRDAKGEVVAGARVELDLESSQARKTSETNAQGEFSFNGLRVGGPYKVSAQKAGLAPVEQSGIQLKAGSNEPLALTMNATEVIQVVGVRNAPVSKKTFFSANDIKQAPSASGDLKDIIRGSADVAVDKGTLSIGGANNRFNSITIDGIRQDDDFGLNGSGYPTQRSPVSLQSIAELTVERSPFDVRYGNFLGGNVNIVTKSGTNDFEGSVTGSYASGELAGKKSKGQTYKNNFSEKKLGFTLGGPIIEDKLHFFASVEGLKATIPNSAGAAGSGAPNQAQKVSVADVERAREISSQVYGFDAGTAGQDQDEDDLKLLAKVDWTISDAHRLETKYQRTTGHTVSPTSVTDTNLPLTSNWYNKTDTLDTVSLRLFSDWASDVSTKFELSQKHVVSEVDPLKGNGFMQAEISTADGGKILLGPDRFRHTNELENDSYHIGGEINYLLQSHQITGGLEQDRIDIYNLFVPGSNGVAEYASLDDFAARNPKSLSYTNAVSNNVRDAAADWRYGVSTFYLQDEVTFGPLVTARFGVRTELYQASDTIARNETFASRYGFDNRSTVDGKQVVLPRLGVSVKANDRLSFRSGLGLYSGGTPTVWLSNSYTNTGVNTDSERVTSAPGFDGRNIPDDLKARLQAGDGNVDALDPNFKVPQTWKFSTGSNYRFDIPNLGTNYILDFDYTYSRVRHGLLWRDLRRNLASIPNNQPTAVGPDGRDLYDTDAANRGPNDFNVNRGYDMLMTNTDKGYGHTASVSLNKSFASGFSFNTSYGWQRIFEVNPGTSSNSSSNYNTVAIEKDPNNPGLTRSNYERTHRFLVSAGYQKPLIRSLDTSFNLFWERRSGQPYSFTFGGKQDDVAGLFGESREFSGRNRMLFYVPKGDGSDVVLEGIDEATFNAYLKKNGLEKYRGKIAPRNAFTSNWVDVVDARITQQLPTASDKTQARLVFDIGNVPNLLNKKWGQVKQADFPYFTRVVDVRYDAPSGRYVYSNLNPRAVQTVRITESIWKLQLGLVYEF